MATGIRQQLKYESKCEAHRVAGRSFKELLLRFENLVQCGIHYLVPGQAGGVDSQRSFGTPGLPATFLRPCGPGARARAATHTKLEGLARRLFTDYEGVALYKARGLGQNGKKSRKRPSRQQHATNGSKISSWRARTGRTGSSPFVSVSEEAFSAAGAAAAALATALSFTASAAAATREPAGNASSVPQQLRDGRRTTDRLPGRSAASAPGVIGRRRDEQRSARRTNENRGTNENMRNEELMRIERVSCMSVCLCADWV